MARRESEVATEKSETSEDGPLDKLANVFVGRLLDYGVDGVGPVQSSSEVLARVRNNKGEDDEKVVNAIVSEHIRKAAVGGFLTGMGGIFTMPVAIPVNVLEFYTLATRMVAAIAEHRGYDVRSKEARSAVLLSLVGADADELMRKAGVSTAAGLTGSGRLATLAMSRLPKAAAMMVNKAVGFRLLTAVGGRALGRLIRFVPVAGGVVGAGLDGYLMKRIADHARAEFAPRAAAAVDQPTG
ncbi:2,4-dihydroxyhept-2-ene-1,7-dioic acid aldolase [Serinicoccus hydrothermalis]|uniref:2,4-dihydroxyhept-2-ene-1,7-dioic acid aldolase n=1 Tax=Serinicoccus hydrothermalis TaxID=1758689 RepID=A0A1B1NA15_9MICO|nr:EcsC family protein [Serinicoccus hydrothermalis]ANS78290.1 2,4-dihydroxyhept-2-ene-1,7-dioic acid aldolase [Serinicoccus hydrothermalis]